MKFYEYKIDCILIHIIFDGIKLMIHITFKQVFSYVILTLSIYQRIFDLDAKRKCSIELPLFILAKILHVAKHISLDYVDHLQKSIQFLLV